LVKHPGISRIHFVKLILIPIPDPSHKPDLISVLDISHQS